jgi:hypothetical protein
MGQSRSARVVIALHKKTSASNNPPRPGFFLFRLAIQHFPMTAMKQALLIPAALMWLLILAV